MYARPTKLSLALLLVGVAALLGTTTLALEVIPPGTASKVSSGLRDEVDQWLTQLDDLIKREDWIAVEALARKIVESTEKEQTVRRVRGLCGLGRSQREQGQLNAALDAYRKASAMAGSLSVESGDRALNLVLVEAKAGQGDSLNGLGRPLEAVPLYEDAITILRRIHNNDHPDLANALGGLGSVFELLGRASEALPVYDEALTMLRRHRGGTHPDIAVMTSNLASALVSLGRDSEALPLLKEALSCRRRLHGGDHPALASAINNLAISLHSVGQTPEALPLFLEGLAMQQRLFEGNHLFVASGLTNVANVLESVGRYKEALALLEEALEILRKLMAGGHPSVALTLSRCADQLRLLGLSSEALRTYEESLAMSRRLYTDDDPSLAAGMIDVATMQTGIRRSIERQGLRDEGIAMWRRLLQGDDHVDLSYVLARLGRQLRSIGNVPHALPLYRAWLTGLSSLVRRSPLSWEAGIDRRAEGFSGLISELPKIVHESEYELVGQARFLLREAATLARAWSVLPESEDLRGLRYEMLSLQAAAERDALAFYDRTSRWKAEAAHERYARALHAKHGDRLRLKAPSLAELGKAVGLDALAVDVYRKTDREKPYYMAVVLGAGSPRFVDLGSEAEIESALSDLSISFAPGSRGADAEEHLRRLDQLTLGKLEPYLKGKSKLHLAVDGALAQVPFAALVSGTSPDSSKPSGKRWRYRVEDLQIGIVPSVLDLAAKSFGSGATGALLVGDVDFDAVASRPTAQGLKHTRMIQPPTGTLGSLPADGKWPALSSKQLDTLRELPMFKQAVVLSGAEATEAALREKVRAPRYLHFFTHGFFTPKNVPEGKSLRLDQIASADDPMYRSALVLAGANAVVPGPPQDDGYLMAAEATRLNLGGTRLVTLAACESGLGDQTVGQGVLGLRRAFRAAGAQGVVMSLYQVPDADTADLMTALYEGLGRGQTAPSALRQAQLGLLRKGKGVYRWGLFVYEGFEK